MAVGKNFLENLTVAMYENSLTVYREFVQNSADSIDKAVSAGVISKNEAQIDIVIRPDIRRISVFDNAYGIPSGEFKKKMLDIADSDKDRNEEKGFRGIGRLAGLGYCDKLIFKTSCKGEEIESIIEWDGEQLRDLLLDDSKHPHAEEVISMITKISQNKKVNVEEHYFEVIMEKVTYESDDLLDESLVIEYLSAVAPVPYANYFFISSEIKKYAAKEGFRLDEYNVLVNANPIHKQYKAELYEGNENNKGGKKKYDEIYHIEFKKFLSKEGVPVAWLWYGISKFEKYIPIMNKMRCIRLRKDNIQIGDENTLGYPRFFKESRGNGYFIGELFVLDKRLIPNARRDYFNPSPELKEFERVLHHFFYTELYELYYYASKVRSAYKTISVYNKHVEDFNDKQQTGFINSEQRENLKKNLEEEKIKAEKAEREIKKREFDVDRSKAYREVFEKIKNTYAPQNTKPDSQVISTKKPPNEYITQKLPLGRKEEKLVRRIYTIINSVLTPDLAKTLIEKLQEELKK